MSRLALIADLHFGSVEGDVAMQLADSLASAQPDLVLVAGDLTMRAREPEFEDYLTWESQLGLPTLVIPGNHDIPVKPWQRFTDPFGAFRRALDRPIQPEHRLPDTHVVGFNTVAPWQPHLTWQEGRARRASLSLARERFAEPAPDQTRIVMAHHPFASIQGVPRAMPVLRAPTALDLFVQAGVQVMMSGHTHLSFQQPVQHGAAVFLALGAPTAMSNRQRGEDNGYWLLDVDPLGITASLVRRDAGRFLAVGAPIRHPTRSSG